MKKILVSILLVTATLFLTVVPALAEESELIATQMITDENGATIIYFDDGSILTISSIQETENAATPYATTQTKSRIATYTDKSGDLMWRYTLYGTFSYEYGVSSTCTNASYTKEIFSDKWSFSDGAAIKSGNTAIGNGVFSYKLLFATLKTYTIDISLTCDKYGNVT